MDISTGIWVIPRQTCNSVGTKASRSELDSVVKVRRWDDLTRSRQGSGQQKCRRVGVSAFVPLAYLPRSAGRDKEDLLSAQ